ncbi:MAG: hypothetical protein ACREHG_08965 [Candidatus Saccharimonadales bacterium]
MAKKAGKADGFDRKLLEKMAHENTWELVAAVVIPIVAGILLDQFFHTFPGLMIAGIFLAALLVVRLAIKNIKSV